MPPARAPEEREPSKDEPGTREHPAPVRLPKRFVAASFGFVLAMLIGVELVFDPTSEMESRTRRHQAEVAFGEALNSGVKRGRIVRRAGRESVHLRFLNGTGRRLDAQVNFRCVALSRDARVLGWGKGKMRLDEHGPLEPEDSLPFVVNLDKLSERSHTISCTVASAV